MSRRASSSRARAVGATLAVAAILTCVLVISVGTATGKPAAKKHVNIALFVAIQSNPVEQMIINNAKAVAKKDGAANFTVFDSEQQRAEGDRQLQGRDRLGQVRRVRAQGRRGPAADELRP